MSIKITDLLRKYNISPKKSLGQNFLVSETALEQIVNAAQISPDGAVLEVGPGLGSLTVYLARAARLVVAVELDDRLLPVLGEVLADYPNVQLVHGDILKLDPAGLMPEDGFDVVANIPYYITSALIRHLLEAQRKPRRLVLTVQREVAERICAGQGKMSLLALGVQVYGKPAVVQRIPAGAFYPAPDVDSAVVKVELYPEPLITTQNLDQFFMLAKAGFGQKRKTLRNSLAGGMHWSGEETAARLQQAGIDPQRRAETLCIEEWGKLVEVCIPVK